MKSQADLIKLAAIKQALLGRAWLGYKALSPTARSMVNAGAGGSVAGGLYEGLRQAPITHDVGGMAARQNRNILTDYSKRILKGMATGGAAGAGAMGGYKALKGSGMLNKAVETGPTSPDNILKAINNIK